MIASSWATMPFTKSRSMPMTSSFDLRAAKRKIEINHHHEEPEAEDAELEQHLQPGVVGNVGGVRILEVELGGLLGRGAGGADAGPERVLGEPVDPLVPGERPVLEARRC